MILERILMLLKYVKLLMMRSKIFPKSNGKLCKNFFFGKGHEGLDALEKNFKIPNGLTKDALLKYEQVAENQIKLGKDKNGVQRRRLEFINKALKELGE